MELRLAHALDGAHDGVVKLLSGLVKIEDQGQDWLRYFTPSPQEVNPRVLQALASQQVDVVTLSPVPRSLEDVYLRVVEA
jgi:ABC-2 type transport system ATP-binding protein